MIVCHADSRDPWGRTTFVFMSMLNRHCTVYLDEKVFFWTFSSAAPDLVTLELILS